MRLVKSTKLGEGDPQHKMWMRMISVRLDSPSKPSDRLVITAEVILRYAVVIYPGIRHRWSRRFRKAVAVQPLDALTGIAACS